VLPIQSSITEPLLKVKAVWWNFFEKPTAENNDCLVRFKLKKKCAQGLFPDQITQQNSLQKAGEP
jgi:hypothetical protein